MMARCIVETGTSSYYSALKDATGEPVLRQIAATSRAMSSATTSCSTSTCIAAWSAIA